MIILYDDFLYSASLDSSARQWDKNTGMLIKSFTIATPMQVFSVDVSEDGQFLFTGTQDSAAFLIQWGVSDSARLNSFIFNRDTVVVVKVSDGNVFSGDYTGLIVQIDISSGLFVKQFVGGSRMFQLILHNDVLFSCEGALLNKWVVSTGELVLSFKPSGLVGTFCFFDGIIFAGMRPFAFVKADPETFTVIHEVNGCYFPLLNG
jgi:WD40 repeat protein